MTTVPRTTWQAGMRVTGDRLAATSTQVGTATVTLTSMTSYTATITFPVPFTDVPIVTTNIATGDGNISRWQSRAITITPTNFILFLYRGDNSDPAATLAGFPVQWQAVQP